MCLSQMFVIFLVLSSHENTHTCNGIQSHSQFLQYRYFFIFKFWHDHFFKIIHTASKDNLCISQLAAKFCLTYKTDLIVWQVTVQMLMYSNCWDQGLEHCENQAKSMHSCVSEWINNLICKVHANLCVHQMVQ